MDVDEKIDEEIFDTKKICSEVLGVLMALGMDYMDKIPSSIMESITKNSDKDLIPKIEKNTPLNKMPISKEAQTYITLLNLQYFCTSEEQKDRLMKKIKDNEIKAQNSAQNG